MQLRLSTLLVLSLMEFSFCFGQKHKTSISPSIKRIVDKMAADNELESEYVGFAGTTTDQWRRFELLKKSATNEELKILTDHKNSVVRCYAFHALACRKTKDVFPILLKHLHDTAQVSTFRGCIMSYDIAGGYFLNVVTPGHVDLSAYKLTQREKAIVDSTIRVDKTIVIRCLENSNR